MAAKNLDYSPKRRLVFEKRSGQEIEEKCLKSVLDHHFNFSVGLFVPALSKSRLCQSISTSSFFNEFCCLADVSLTEFIHSDFVDSFVKQESVLALSHGTRIDTSDCVALLSTGILYLSLTKDTYECLGIQGKPSKFSNELRYDVEINLLAPYFKPNKKHYERVKRGFQQTQMKFKFLVSSVSPPGPSTQDLGSYFKAHGIPYQPFRCENKIEEFFQIKMPCISYDNPTFPESASYSTCDSLSFHEWLGGVVCGVDCSDAAPNSFVNTLCCPTPCQLTDAVYSKWTGFLTSKCIQDLLKKARKLLSENPDIPLLSVLVWGFSDCPVSWRQRRHGYYISGDNHYTLVMFQNEQVWMYRTLGNNDELP